ncbi:hydrolase [Sugiyamaella lignohabitans]|uniref:Hydrolase n=1 Tax=Sugiyamaella lignohabitans TaxID=796027 RepID=A0A167D5A2_9ASCO|nr:hydrolase [Sugiyamaella lignohabitans]ANB12501.1 hydrolase [Sugiyamaella lignohabitans]
MPYSLVVDELGNFRDGKNRVVVLRGINLDGSSKLPAKPPLTTYTPVDETNPNDPFWDGDNVSFIGRPLDLEEAPEHLERIRSWGYNTIRYLYSWEAIEHSGPGIYDDDFIDYSIKVLKLLKSYGFYIILDPHQDVWGRYSGGSGAPLWTYYLVGMDPKTFTVTNAAFVQNLFPKEEGGPENFPKMFWATNYYRFVCQVMFTLFFAGRHFAPNAIVNGKNIQDYLQDSLLDAMIYFYKQIEEKAGELYEIDEVNGGGGILGSETLNEPNPGLAGFKDIGVVPKTQNLKLGTTPTAFQSMLLASGHAVTVENYEFGSLGPKRVGTKSVDPKGVSVWCTDNKYDLKYGWERSSTWKLGECIWAQHGVWDPQSLKLLKPEYFAFDHQGKEIDDDQFVNIYFVEYWTSFYRAHRQHLPPQLYLMCQPPVLALPPNLKGTDLIDNRVVYAPHFYDGITLMLKRWSRVWNVDTLGYIRGKYSSPIFAIKLGESNIRKCLQEQFSEIKAEGREYMGSIASFMTETGIPFDMDNRKAYSDGDYSSQIAALDTTSSAVEASNFNVAFWGYTTLNKHERGDFWNGEDFSFWSSDSNGPKPESKKVALNDEHDSDSSVLTRVRTEVSNQASVETLGPRKKRSTSGVRAVAAILRPFPLSIVGTIHSYSFDLQKSTFRLTINAERAPQKETPTEIYVPEYHFSAEDMAVEVTSGRWVYDLDTQVLSWWHAETDKQTIQIQSSEDIASSSGCSCCIM